MNHLLERLVDAALMPQDIRVYGALFCQQSIGFLRPETVVIGMVVHLAVLVGLHINPAQLRVDSLLDFVGTPRDKLLPQRKRSESRSNRNKFRLQSTIRCPEEC